MARKTVLHFLRSYLLLLVCLLLLLLPLYYGTISLFEKRQLALTEETLSSGLSLLDQQIAALSGVALSVGQDAEYRVFAARDPQSLTPADYIRLNTLYAEFRRLCLAQTYVEDYGLLLKNRLLFTKERLHLPPDGYYGAFMAFGDMDENEFYNAFSHPTGVSQYLPAMTVRIGEGKTRVYDAVVWLCSMSQIYAKNPTGVFFATLSRDALASLLMAGFENEQAGFILSTKQGEVLLRHGLGVDPPKNAHVLSGTAAQTGLRVTLYLSDTLFIGMMAPIRNLLIGCFLGLALAGVLFSGVLALRASRPVRRLVTLVNEAGNAAPDREAAKNSFDLIGNAVIKLNSTVDEYKSALSLQQVSVREHVFETLLRETPFEGSQVDQRHLREFARCFPDFPQRYRLGLVSIANPGENGAEDVDALPARQVALRGLIDAQLSPVPYAYVSGRRAVLALDTQAGADYVGPLTLLKRTAKEKLHIRLLIALSEEGASPVQLHALYTQARDILRLAALEGDNSPVAVWQKQNFPDQRETIPFDYQEMAQLHALLLRGEKEAALALLSAVRAELRPESFLDEVMARQVFYNIRGVLLRVKMERYEPLFNLDVPDYHGEAGSDGLIDALKTCCAVICDALAPKTNAPQAAFNAAVCRFIDEHLGDSALSAGMAADRFAISEPTLQKVIRQEKGCSFFDYVERGRYQMAVSLLTDTDTPITDVALKCGYNSPNSFYKAFKRVSGLTPAAVRQGRRR